MTEIISILQMGGDAAIIVLCVVLWKFDRRLIRIEQTLHNHISSEEGKLDLVIAALVRKQILTLDEILSFNGATRIANMIRRSENESTENDE